MQKDKKGLKQLTKKDSEMYHAKALHISSLFLPKTCPLVQHITQSYNKNYLKDKKEQSLEEFLEAIGIVLEKEKEKEIPKEPQPVYVESLVKSQTSQKE